MKCDVRWKKSAEEDLAAIWLAATDRQLITRAAREVDRILQIDPDSVGESRPSARRIAIVVPLGVTFEIHPMDRLVRVLEVWKFKTPG